MSKITMTINICEARQIKRVYEKIICVVCKDRIDTYRVPYHNYIITKEDGTFKWEENRAIPCGDSLICFFRSFRNISTSGGKGNQT